MATITPSSNRFSSSNPSIAQADKKTPYAPEIKLPEDFGLQKTTVDSSASLSSRSITPRESTPQAETVHRQFKYSTGPSEPPSPAHQNNKTEYTAKLLQRFSDEFQSKDLTTAITFLVENADDFRVLFNMSQRISERRLFLIIIILYRVFKDASPIYISRRINDAAALLVKIPSEKLTPLLKHFNATISTIPLNRRLSYIALVSEIPESSLTLKTRESIAFLITHTSQLELKKVLVAENPAKACVIFQLTHLLCNNPQFINAPLEHKECVVDAISGHLLNMEPSTMEEVSTSILPHISSVTLEGRGWMILFTSLFPPYLRLKAIEFSLSLDFLCDFPVSCHFLVANFIRRFPNTLEPILEYYLSHLKQPAGEKSSQDLAEFVYVHSFRGQKLTPQQLELCIRCLVFSVKELPSSQYFAEVTHVAIKRHLSFTINDFLTILRIARKTPQECKLEICERFVNLWANNSFSRDGKLEVAALAEASPSQNSYVKLLLDLLCEIPKNEYFSMVRCLWSIPPEEREHFLETYTHIRHSSSSLNLPFKRILFFTQHFSLETPTILSWISSLQKKESQEEMLDLLEHCLENDRIDIVKYSISLFQGKAEHVPQIVRCIVALFLFPKNRALAIGPVLKSFLLSYKSKCTEDRSRDVAYLIDNCLQFSQQNYLANGRLSTDEILDHLQDLLIKVSDRFSFLDLSQFIKNYAEHLHIPANSDLFRVISERSESKE